jgi:hypothetical protein
MEIDILGRKMVMQQHRITDPIGRQSVARIGEGSVSRCLVLRGSLFYTRNCRRISDNVLTT